MKYYLIAFTTPTSERPIDVTRSKNFDINEMPDDSKIVWYGEENSHYDILNYWKILLRKESRKRNMPLPMEIENFSHGRIFTERKSKTYNTKDGQGNFFYDGTKFDGKIDGGNKSETATAIFDDVYFYMVRTLKDNMEELKRKFSNTNMQETQYDKYIKLLEANHNIVLTGAPGTGKTFLAREIVAEILTKDNVEKDNNYNNYIEFVQFHPSYDYTDFVEGLRPIEKNGTIGFERKDGVFKDFCKRAVSSKDNDFVFIIDEINRGEISKIFGELFFSIDPGYRGEEGRVNTQYQNMITDKDDAFYDGFYVPENVYIIGTMNDIDRSVESMDFAMRRRFTWIDVTAEESIENMGISGEKKDTMIRLNNVIKDMDGLGKDYQLGGAYFLDDMSKEERWRYRIEGLLREYLRGMNNVDEKMEILKKAYDGRTDNNEVDAD